MALGTTVESLSMMDTIENQQFVEYSGVTSSRHGMLNWAVEHNVAGFSELYFAVRWQGRMDRG